jgi:hypothetical protein
MSFRRFYAQSLVKIEFFLDVEVDVSSATDIDYITEKIQEQTEEKLAEELPKKWLDDVEVDVVSIK